jgi:3-methyladenine DNA glycosylase Mpg
VTTTSEQLRALLPPLDTAEEAEYRGVFLRIAELLLNQTTFYVQEIPHRFTEIEFYFKGGKHQDKFTHCDIMQREFGAWYFHRTGGEYRGGTYKGLDLAFGGPELFAGILIRGIERIDGNKEYYDGPCMLVDHILQVVGKTQVRDLAESFDRKIDPPASGDSPLYVKPSEAPRAQEIYVTPRVGLSLKRSANEDRQRFVARKYRYLTEPILTKKGKLHVVTSLHHQGKSSAEIARITGSRESVIKGYIEAFEAGKTRPVKDFTSDLSTTDTCGLFGFCHQWL